jgi:hypothetical protein
MLRCVSVKRCLKPLTERRGGRFFESGKSAFVNVRMMAVVLCNYLQEKLLSEAIVMPIFSDKDCCWWLDMGRNGFRKGFCV